MKLDFEMSDGVYTLKDALNLPDDHTLTSDQIDALKMNRFGAWVSHLKSVEITDADVQSEE